MAKVIEFYVPDRFREARRWKPSPEQRGKVIEFLAPLVTDVTSVLRSSSLRELWEAAEKVES